MSYPDTQLVWYIYLNIHHKKLTKCTWQFCWCPCWDGENVTLSRVKWPPTRGSKGHGLNHLVDLVGKYTIPWVSGIALHGFCIVNCFFGIGFVLALRFGKLVCGGTSKMQFDLSAYFWQTGWFNHPPKKEVGIFVLPKPSPTGYFFGFRWIPYMSLSSRERFGNLSHQTGSSENHRLKSALPAWEGDVMWSFPGGYPYPWICLVGDFLRILPWQITIFHHHLGHICTFSNQLKEIQAII